MAKKAAAKKPSSEHQPPRLRIRMYRQGLGDCFLLTFDGRIHVLIDCGVIVGTKDPVPLMERVVRNIRSTVDPKADDTDKVEIDVLVVTHEHWDHVSGFKQARKEFDKLKFKQVWMAWTEDEGNELGKKLRHERATKTKAAKAAHKKLKGGKKKALSLMAQGVGGVLGFAGIGLGADAASGGDTGLAMKYARDRGEERGSDLKILHPEKPSFMLPGAENVRVYVLGPPEDEKLIKKSDPSKAHSEVYVSAATAFLAAADPLDKSEDGKRQAEESQPFAFEYRIQACNGRPRARKTAGFHDVNPSKALRDLFAHYLADGESYRTIEDDWLASAGSLALKLDSDTNNTSLVLAFEFTDTKEREVFLFPGDAQVGNWLSWDKYKWRVKDKDGDKRTVNAADLLARTVFYKVGHHGSHNATLEAGGLERMTSKDLVAMIPVNKAMAKKKTWKMPWPRLRKRLEEKCSTLIVQDEGIPEKKPRRGRITEHKPGKPDEKSLYIDYEV